MPRSLGLAFLVVCALMDVSDAACSRQSGGAVRFILKGSEARDTGTGLTWQRCSAGMTWNERQGCAGERTLMSLNDARKSAEAAGAGWRVPTVDELHGPIDRQCGRPPVDLKAFPDLRAGGDEPVDGRDDRIYWASSKVGMAGLIYYVDFATGDVDAYSRGFPLALRLVQTDRQAGSEVISVGSFP